MFFLVLYSIILVGNHFKVAVSIFDMFLKGMHVSSSGHAQQEKSIFISVCVLFKSSLTAITQRLLVETLQLPYF